MLRNKIKTKPHFLPLPPSPQKRAQEDEEIPGLLRLEGTSWDHLVQPYFAQTGTPIAGCTGSCPGSVVYVQWLMLHNLLKKPVLSHPYSKKCFLMLKENFLCCILCTFWSPLKRELVSPAFVALLQVFYGHWWDLMESSLLQHQQSQLSQPFFVGKTRQHLHIQHWKCICEKHKSKDQPLGFKQALWMKAYVLNVASYPE